MPKLPECIYCRFYARNYYLICSLHPAGPNGDKCSDFASDPELEDKRFEDFLDMQRGNGEEPYTNPFPNDPDAEQWEPEETRYVNGELIIARSYYNGEEMAQSHQRRTLEEQIKLPDYHPLLTGICPRCEMPIPYDVHLVHYDCSHCGWVDDSV